MTLWGIFDGKTNQFIGAFVNKIDAELWAKREYEEVPFITIPYTIKNMEK